MAKALIGHLPQHGQLSAQLTVENAKLRQRVADLTHLIGSLQAENDLLRAEAALVIEPRSAMQPA